MMVVLFLLSTQVYQHGDTLMFMKQDSIRERWILGEDIQKNDSLTERVIKKAKVSSNNKFFLIYEERQRLSYEHVLSEIIFYDADRKEFWRESRRDTQRISLSFS